MAESQAAQACQCLCTKVTVPSPLTLLSTHFFSATAYSCPVTSVLEVWLPWATVGKQQMVVIWMKIDVIFYT